MDLFKKKCPRCGSTKLDVGGDGTGLYCTFCGNAWSEKRQVSEGGGGSRFSRSGVVEHVKKGGGGSLIDVLIIVLVVGASMFSPLTKPVKDTAKEILAIPIPDIADYWGTVWTILSVFIIIVLSTYAYSNGFLGVTVVWVLLMAVIVFVYYVLPTIMGSLGIDIGDYVGSLRCMLVGRDMLECQIGDDGEEPDFIKEGDYDVLEASFDTAYTGNVIYKSGGYLMFDTYFINLEFRNPSDSESVKGFHIKSCDASKCTEGSYIRRGGTIKTKEKITLATLETVDGLYMDGSCPDEDCEIKPGETLRLTLKAVPNDKLCDGSSEESCESVDVCEWDDGNSTCVQGEDGVTTEAEATVEFAYDYASEGKYEFVVAHSDEVLRPLIANRKEPTSSAGPLDVKVYFAPSAYVLRTGSTQPEIGVVVKLLKDEAGTAYVKSPIRVSRLEDGVLTPPQICTSPWGADLTLSNNPDATYSELIQLGVERSLKESHTYVCKYAINPNGVGEDGEIIPFIVRADYRYEKAMTNRYIEVVEE